MVKILKGGEKRNDKKIQLNGNYIDNAFSLGRMYKQW